MVKRAARIFALPLKTRWRGLGERGATIYLVMGLLIATGTVIYYLLDLSRNLNNSNRVQRIIVEKEDLRRFLDVMFSNRALCLRNLRISGDRFDFGDLLKPEDRYLRSFRIMEMRINDVKQLNPQLKSGKFTVRFETGMTATGPVATELSHRVSFRENGAGGVTECVGQIDGKTACARIGMSWDDTLKICDLCPVLGYKRVRGKCV